ncbi:uncharacterized protein IWX75_001292 [Arthrobacter sp. CAN_A6]
MNPRSPSPDSALFDQLAREIGVRPWQVRAAVELLDSGATVPFIARYRKELTGTLDDTDLRTLDERLRYLRELEERRRTIREAIQAQGKLTPELDRLISDADTKSRLEDVYLPYRTTRRTKAQAAREAGLEPLADALLARPALEPGVEAMRYLGGAVPTPEDALAGARAILLERAAQNADLLTAARERLWSKGVLRSQVAREQEVGGQKFRDYFDFVQAPASMPSHRVLALFRGEKEGVLEVTVHEAPPSDPAALVAARAGFENAVARALGVTDRGRPSDAWLLQTVQQAWRRILTKLSLDVRARLFQNAETEAVRVFAANLRDVLLAAPAGSRPALGLDPGLRTGVKVAVVDGTGRAVATETVYPHAPRNNWEGALSTLTGLIERHGVELLAIGNGTASRETDKLASELLHRLPGRKLQKLVVSEAGASVYSASALASAELPGMDVSLRGAVSIARRLQDPLAELVKIDPRSIGVGQYQHDVAPAKLERSLAAVIEDCVNAVGVDVNTASPALLARVAGVGTLLSENIVAHRNTNGPFLRRADLLKVPRLGAKAFEQCAGFLRVSGGAESLDASSVHPEAYPLARRMLAAAAGAPVRTLDPQEFVSAGFGLPTVLDILAELEKPARDPRPGFTTASFQEGVEQISDLVPGMILDGVVTNVAAFGAFVDVGVHQDGLVHVSAMADRFVGDPHQVVRSGQVVRVRVVDADTERKRIALTMRLDDDAARVPNREPVRSGGSGRRRSDEPAAGPDPKGTGRGDGADLRGAGRRGGAGVPAPGRDRKAAPRPGGDGVPSTGAMAEALKRAGLA